VEFYTVLLKEHLEIVLQMLELGIHSSISSPKLTGVGSAVFECSDSAGWPGKMPKFSFLLALQSMTEQFQLCEWKNCHLGELNCYSEIMSGSWDASGYSTCPCAPLQQFSHEG
jgi:hypothetical protein